jgi:hypothetical protein
MSGSNLNLLDKIKTTGIANLVEYEGKNKENKLNKSQYQS